MNCSCSVDTWTALQSQLKDFKKYVGFVRDGMISIKKERFGRLLRLDVSD